MRPLLLSSSLVTAATITLLAQTVGSLPDESKQKLLPSCTISGRVVTAAEGIPLKSAHVMLIEENAGRDPWCQSQFPVSKPTGGYRSSTEPSMDTEAAILVLGLSVCASSCPSGGVKQCVKCFKVGLQDIGQKFGHAFLERLLFGLYFL